MSYAAFGLALMFTGCATLAYFAGYTAGLRRSLEEQRELLARLEKPRG